VAELGTLVEVIARALADAPDDVRVTQGERRGAVHLELQVAPRDLGRVIGRQGRTAAAIRALLTAAGEAGGQRVQLDIRDTDGRS
jgi:predicted RNA-binding protein YlqC (UPF0109 family)